MSETYELVIRPNRFVLEAGSPAKLIAAGMQGPAGPAGADGAAGPAGPAGADGAAGPAGPAGPGVVVGGATGQVLAKASAADYDTTWITVAGTGTVTSVSLTAPGLFAVAGSPVSTAGTLALSFASQAANTVLAGPTSGAAAAPTMRALVAADLPATVAYTGVANTFSATQTLGVGTLLAAPNKAVTLSANADNWNPGVARHYRVNATADVIISGMAIGQQDGWEWYIHNAGTGRIFLPSGSANSLAANRFFNVGNFQILLNPGESLRCVYDGTLSLIRTWKLYDPGTQSLNTVLAGPASGPPGLADVPVFRALVAADLPAATVLTTGSYANPAWVASLDAAKITSGTLPDARLSANVPLLTGGKLPTSTIPALAITEFLGTVASQAAMLALVGQRGDWCIRSDDSHVYILTTDDPTQAANWQSVSYPSAPVASVNGQTGAVVLAAADVGAQPSDAELTALAGLTSAADRVPYFTGSGTAALATFTAAGRALAGGADAAAQRTTLGLGTLATKSTVTLTADVTGVLPSGNLPTTVVYGNVAGIPHRVGWVLARGTPATVGTNKAGVKVRLPYAGTFKKVWVDAETGPTGAALILDIKLNGTSLWATTPANRPQVAAGATSGTQTAFDTASFAAGDYLTIDVAQVGSTVAGQDIAVALDCLEKNQ